MGDDKHHTVSTLDALIAKAIEDTKSEAVKLTTATMFAAIGDDNEIRALSVFLDEQRILVPAPSI